VQARTRNVSKTSNEHAETFSVRRLASTCATFILQFPACLASINAGARQIRRAFSKKYGARFKNARAATDRIKKSDNVEPDDSEKFAEREIISRQFAIGESGSSTCVSQCCLEASVAVYPAAIAVPDECLT
jgi:hypothetical protein